jgi:hypothetical protein
LTNSGTAPYNPPTVSQCDDTLSLSLSLSLGTANKHTNWRRTMV